MADGSTWVTKYRCVKLNDANEQQDMLWKRWKEGVA
jgi:hypothetical protein